MEYIKIATEDIVLKNALMELAKKSGAKVRDLNKEQNELYNNLKSGLLDIKAGRNIMTLKEAFDYAKN